MRIQRALITMILLGIICPLISSQIMKGDLPDIGPTIDCDDISVDGIGSSYLSHTFTLSRGDVNITAYHWKFLLKNRNGEFVQVSDCISESFTIGEIISPDDYYHTENGELDGRVECEYILNGISCSAAPFAVLLDLKPSILSIDDLEVINHGQYTFSLQFTVRYVGADMLYVELEEEFISAVRYERYYEPYIAHVNTGKMSNHFYSWVTLKVTNKYGTTTETMEYAPVYPPTAITDVEPDSTSEVIRILLYNLNGAKVFDSTPSEFSRLQLKQGIYIKNEIYENGESKTSKICLP